jgi:hypothetical protein
MRTCEPFNLKHRGVVYTVEFEQRDDIGWVYRWRGAQDAASSDFVPLAKLWPSNTCAEAAAVAAREIRYILYTEARRAAGNA